jgi:hypothetical protein
MNNGRTQQARIWIGTIPVTEEYDINHRLDGVQYARGQLEEGKSGYRHWQVVCHFGKPVRLAAIKKRFGSGTHWEPTRSSAADSFVWKDDTAVEGTRFEHGSKPIQRSSPKDWDSIVQNARDGRMDQIPSDILVRLVFAVQKSC